MHQKVVPGNVKHTYGRSHPLQKLKILALWKPRRIQGCIFMSDSGNKTTGPCFKVL